MPLAKVTFDIMLLSMTPSMMKHCIVTIRAMSHNIITLSFTIKYVLIVIAIWLTALSVAPPKG